MRAIRSHYINGVMLEMLQLSETRFLVRKRKGGKSIASKEFTNVAQAEHYFAFIKQ